ncbi:hypothetical protein B0H13DRAFT_1031511 [Mycena leptocephala]|nr:hypothetical protein B0H13DRAFT_1031511 [Mycena leptocephala]
MSIDSPSRTGAVSTVRSCFREDQLPVSWSTAYPFLLLPFPASILFGMRYRTSPPASAVATGQPHSETYPSTALIILEVQLHSCRRRWCLTWCLLGESNHLHPTSGHSSVFGVHFMCTARPMVKVRRVHQDTPSLPLKSLLLSLLVAAINKLHAGAPSPSAPLDSSHSLAASLIDPASVRRIFKYYAPLSQSAHTPPGDVGAFEGPNVLLTAMELGVGRLIGSRVHLPPCRQRS